MTFFKSTDAYIIIIILIIIIIILLYYNDKSGFSVMPKEMTVVGKVDLSEDYNYLTCGPECVDTTKKLKPHFKYRIGNRCFFNDTNDYLFDDIPNINWGSGYTGPISSCILTSETRFYKPAPSIPIDYMARYDASDNTTVRNASGNACTVGEAVATLLDKSSNHYDLVQATNNRRPFLIYNTTYKKNMIDPNMSRSRFMRNASLTLSQYFTIITVTYGISPESRVWNFAGSVGNGTLIANTYGEVWLPGSRSAWVKGTPHFENGITVVRYNNRNTVKCINVSTTNVTTIPINEAPFTTNLLMSGFELGNYYTDYSYTGGIGEIIIYNRALTDAEVTDTINTLRAKWTV